MHKCHAKYSAKIPHGSYTRWTMYPRDHLVGIYFWKQEAQRAIFREPEYNGVHLFDRWAYGLWNFCLLIGLKTALNLRQNTLEIWVYLKNLDKCPFGGFRGEVNNVSAVNHWNKGGHLVFPIGPYNTNLVFYPIWDLASCQVSLNSVRRFQMRSRTNISANQRPGRPWWNIPIGPKNTNSWSEEFEILLAEKYSLNSETWRSPLEEARRQCLSQ